MGEEKKEERREAEQKEKTTVAIRGIDERLYREAVRVAREVGWTVGEVVNYSLKLFLETFPELAEKVKESTKALVIMPTKEFLESTREAIKSDLHRHYHISNLREVILTKSDLEGLDKPLVISAVKRLVVSEDVPFELFDSKVSSVRFVDEVVVPKAFPRVRLYTKLKYVNEVTFTEPT